MFKVFKTLYFPLFILFLTVSAGIYLRPLLPVDETRYISVAWEMFSKHSFLVPLLNGEPYHHKPPLLFWLIDFIWYIFGVSQNTVRFIPSFFAAATLAIIYLFAKNLWEEDEKSSYISPLVLSSMAFFTFFSSMLTFDIMLTFWVTLLSYFIFLAAKRESFKYWIFAGIAIGGGALTKGPVILVHTLPVILLISLWKKDIDKKRWFLGFLSAFFIGLFIALLWAIPAAIEGGEEYRKAIFWGQSANRVVSSFAHRHPFWWYLPFLFVLFLPWFLFDKVLESLKSVKFFYKKNEGVRFLIVWLIGAVFLFSLISGKQIQYLLPEIPAAALLFSRFISLKFSEISNSSSKYISALYIFIGVVLSLGVGYLAFIENRYSLRIAPLLIMSLFIIFIGIALKKIKYPSANFHLKAIALSVSIFIISLHAGMIDVWKIQSLKQTAQKIKELQNRGKEIAVVGKYHGEYHFLGRLTKPLIVIKKDKKAYLRFVKKHPQAVVVYRVKKNKNLKIKPFFRYPFRNGWIIFMKPHDLFKV